MDALADSTKIRRLTHRETRLIVIGMLLPVFMGSLDQTILASALPSIGRDLGDAPDLTWLITAYLLASTAPATCFAMPISPAALDTAACSP